jgi:hypothetical protein
MGKLQTALEVSKPRAALAHQGELAPVNNCTAIPSQFRHEGDSALVGVGGGTGMFVVSCALAPTMWSQSGVHLTYFTKRCLALLRHIFEVTVVLWWSGDVWVGAETSVVLCISSGPPSSGLVVTEGGCWCWWVLVLVLVERVGVVTATVP